MLAALPSLVEASGIQLKAQSDMMVQDSQTEQLSQQKLYLEESQVTEQQQHPVYSLQQRSVVLGTHRLICKQCSILLILDRVRWVCAPRLVYLYHYKT